MGMPEQTQNRMNITPDGVVYEVLDDGTISKIARVMPNKEIILFGETKVVGDNWNCPNCGAKEITSKFCPECGTKKTEKTSMTCKICGQKCYVEGIGSINFCPSCGELRKFTHNDFIDHGEYIELKNPIGKIRMIEKYQDEELDVNCDVPWNRALEYAKRLRKGGFTDWRIPTVGELLVISKLDDDLGISCCGSDFWTDDSGFSVRNDIGTISETDENTDLCSVLCVR